MYSDDEKSKYSSNLNGIIKSAKPFIQKRQAFKTANAELFSKISNKKKISNKEFHHCEENIFLDKVTKSINS